MQGKDLTKGNLVTVMMEFSIPYFCACFLQLLYNMADLYFVGKFCNVPTITAVTIGGQVLHMLTVMIVGMAMDALCVWQEPSAPNAILRLLPP